MILISYIDIVRDDNTELTVMSPFDIGKDEILSVGPYFSSEGKLFKNVSIVRDKYGNAYKVVGNYKDIVKMTQGEFKNKLGYR